MAVIKKAIEELRAGKFIVVTDDHARENEGDLILAAQFATPESLAFMVRHTSGIICAPMLESDLKRLALPQMVPENTESHGTAFTISVDLKHGTDTGISASDRSKTIRALCSLDYTADDFLRPGHIFPLRYMPGGVLSRAGHTEASIDLMNIAELQPIAILSELVTDDGPMRRGDDLDRFAKKHNLHVISVQDVILHRHQHERTVENISKRELRSASGPLIQYQYKSLLDNSVATAIVHGNIERDSNPVVRVQVECSTTQLPDTVEFADSTCFCRRNLAKSLGIIQKSSSGVVIIVREGSHGTCTAAGKILNSQNDSINTRPSIWKNIGIGSQILSDLGVTRMTLLATSERRYPALEGFGLTIEKIISLVEE